MKRILIIIVNFEQEKELIGCLSSLNKIDIPSQTSVHLLVIDNSQQLSAPQIRKYLKLPFELLTLKQNIGFARAVNHGLRRGLARGDDYFLLLNPDTKVSHTLLNHLLKVFKLDATSGIIGPLIRFVRGKKTIYDLGGKVDRYLGRTSHNETLKKPKNGLLYPDYISGCCMLIPKKVLDKVGFFDERYFLYYEDADYCLQAQSQGFSVVVTSQASIYHYLKESKSAVKKKRLIISHYLFIQKQVKSIYKPLALIYWLIISLKIFLSE